jgi:hypothetical protein
MADKKISQLTSATLPLAGTEVVPVVQSGATVKVSAASLGAAAAYTPAGVGAVVTTVQSKLREFVSVKDFGAVGDFDFGTLTGTNNTSAFQAAANACDAENLSSLCIPNSRENYLITAPIVFTRGDVRIFGFSGCRVDYDKKGHVVPKSGISRAFDLGGSRLTPAVGCWTIDGISIRPETATNAIDGFVFTSKADGPDRPVVIRNCTGVFLNSAVRIPSRGVASALATLVIENNHFTSCNYALLADYGNIFGARIVGNNLEQNLLGGIWGAFNGPVYIADNMLEGQPNAIRIQTPEVIGGNLANVVIERNYFESNGGSFVVRMECSSDTSLTVRDNFWMSPLATDDIVVTGAANCLLTVREELMRQVPVTFIDYTGVISYGSDFLNNVTPYFYVRTFGSQPPFIVNADYQNDVLNPAYPTSLYQSQSKETGLAHYDTPYGYMACAGYSEYVDIPLTVNIGNAVQLDIFCQIEEGADFNLYVFDEGVITATVAWLGYNANQITCNGRWALVTIPFLSTVNTSKLKIRVDQKGGSTGRFLIAGASAVNKGAHVNDGSVRTRFDPKMPSRVINQTGSNYQVTSTSGTTAIVNTGINPTKNTSNQTLTASVYDVVVSGMTNASTNNDSSISYGIVTVFNTGTSYTIAYSQTSAVGDNPFTVTAVFWNGTTESATSAGGDGIQMRIKVAGYLNTAGYMQNCQITKRIETQFG